MKLIHYIAIAIAWLVAELVLAPLGHEDKNGFHYD